MPKETYTIKNFAKGLMSHVEARDLEDDAVYLSEGIDYSDVGKIRILGDGYGDTLLPALASYLSGGALHNERITSFQYDYDLGIQGTEDGALWDSDDSLSGYLGPPRFREGGVTYYVVTSGNDRNEISIIASYKNDDGVQVFTTINYNKAKYNSIGRPEGITGSDPDAWHSFGGTFSEYKMKVGTDPGADIVGYWIGGGFRYCDANFDNKNNNVVGYFGHINRSYLTSLTKLRQPGVIDELDAEYVDTSFTRNHWHFQNYDNLNRNYTGANPPASGFLGDGNGEHLMYQTEGFFGMTNGCYWTEDGRTEWYNVMPNDPENQGGNFPNSRMKIFVGPNVDRTNDGDGEEDHDLPSGAIVYGGDGSGITSSVNESETNNQNGHSITFGQGAHSGDNNEGSDSTPLYKGSMPDGHELRTKWLFGTSVLYDGDPKGICQETGICTVRDSKTTGSGANENKLDTYFPRILNLKDQSNYLDPDLPHRDPWIRILGTSAGNDMAYYADATSDTLDYHGQPHTDKKVLPGDFDALPKIYFTWTFLPWWADTKYIITPDDDGVAFETSEDEYGVTSHHNTFWPPYDSRMTGFRLYMQNMENKEQVWHNVATVDALRGMVYYNGCSVKEHQWIPCGKLSDSNGFVTRRELGHPENLNEVRRIACWSNMSTGRSNINWKGGGASIELTPMDDWGNYHDEFDIKADPLVHSGCNSSVNIESIPDVTYELLNGYKQNYSPTQHWRLWHNNVGPLTYSHEDPTKSSVDKTSLASSWGAVYRFKTVTVLNDRVYIGNIMDNKTLKQYPDRILKTEPGQYDIFPDDGFHHIDLASDDGDSIIKIMAYNGKIFVWKHHTLYVLKITEEGDEQIESQHHHYGIDNQYQVTTTKHGPCWFNEGGLYLYTHENKIENLVAGKLSQGKYMPNLEFWLNEEASIGDMISDSEFIQQLTDVIIGELTSYPDWWDINSDGIMDSSDVIAWINEYVGWHNVDDIYVSQIEYGWRGFVASDGSNGKPSPMIGYIQNDDKIVIYKSSNDNGLAGNSGDSYLYDFTMKNFSFGKQLFPYGKGVTKSNFVHDSLGNLIYLANFTPSVTTDDFDEDTRMYKWDEEARNKHSVRFITKDIDFESPGIRKKVYKIYISASGEYTPNVKVFYAINGSKKFKPGNIFTGLQNYDISEGFQPPNQGTDSNEWIQDKWYTAILKPSTSGESLGNIYSIQFLFIGKNEAELSSQDEIEDLPPLESNKNTGDFVSKTFQINDISIIYRSKNAR